MTWSGFCTRPKVGESGGTKLRGEKSNNHILKNLARMLMAAVLLCSTQGLAQTSTAQLEGVSSDASLKKYSFSIGTEYQTNLRKNSSPDQDNSTSLNLVGEYVLRPQSSITAEIDIIRSHKSDGSTQLSNLVIAYKLTEYEILKELSFKPILYTILPTNERAREDQTFNGALMIRPVMVYRPSNISDLTITNSLYLVKQFHEYNVQRNYAQNTEYILRYRLDVGYNLLEKLSIGGRADYIRGWTYSRFAKDNFYLMQYLGYQLNSSWSTYVAHENQGAIRGANNYGNNIEVFSEKSSYVSLGIRHIF